MCIKERISAYCKRKNIAISRLEKLSGLSNGYFNQVKKRPSLDKIEMISKVFPDLNTNWLLTGEGEMLNPNVIQKNQNGDNIHGDTVTVNKSETASFLELLKKKDEQIDNLISIINKLSDK